VAGKKLAPYIDQLGKVPDGEIAALAGVQRKTVINHRKRLGIPPYMGHRFQEGHHPTARASSEELADQSRLLQPFVPDLGQIPDRVVAERVGLSVEAVRRFRLRNGISGRRGRPPVEAPPRSPATPVKRKGRRSALTPFASEVGHVPDRELAERAGVTVENVRAYRRRRGIPAYWRNEAPPASSASEATVQAGAGRKAVEQQAFAVVVHADGVEGQYVVVAPDIATAAARAVSRSVRLGSDVSVREIRYLGRALLE